MSYLTTAKYCTCIAIISTGAPVYGIVTHKDIGAVMLSAVLAAIPWLIALLFLTLHRTLGE